MTVGIGRAELFRIQKGWAKVDPATNKAASALRDGYYPGDLDFDPLNLKPEDPAELRIMQVSEIKSPPRDTSQPSLTLHPPAPSTHAPFPAPLNPSPPPPLMQDKELSHGRLAMIAAAGFLAQEGVSGDTWGSWWGDASF